MEEPSARREAERGTFDPTYLVYSVGKLMLLKLRQDYKQQQQGKSFSLRSFHDTLLAQGTRVTGGNPSSLVAADLNRDGYPDLAITNADDGSLSIYLHSRRTSGALSTLHRSRITYAVGGRPIQVLKVRPQPILRQGVPWELRHLP